MMNRATPTCAAPSKACSRRRDQEEPPVVIECVFSELAAAAAKQPPGTCHRRHYSGLQNEMTGDPRRSPRLKDKIRYLLRRIDWRNHCCVLKVSREGELPVTWWADALWKQFGAAIDALDKAVQDCPDDLWTGGLWKVHWESPDAPDEAEFWYIAYHTIFWLDVYLSGEVEGFTPPTPFTLSEFDPAGALPDRTYTKEELRVYLAYTRQKCQSTLAALTEQTARRQITFGWMKSAGVGFFELQLYSMRHVQEHASQLHMFLGQHRDEEIKTWVARARES